MTMPVAGSWYDIVGGAVTLLVFVAGLWQYWSGQRWKRAEFVAEEVRRFREQPGVRSAIMMLDYNRRKVELFAFEERPADRVYDVNDELVKAALEDVDRESREQERVEDAIRDCFDQLLDGFERFELFIRAGLVTQKQLEPYLKYWAEQLVASYSNKPNEIVELSRKYIRKYYFDEAETLCSRYTDWRPRKGPRAVE